MRSIIFAVITALALFATPPAAATSKKPPQQEQGQAQGQRQAQGQIQGQSQGQTAKGGHAYADGGNAHAEGGSARSKAYGGEGGDADARSRSESRSNARAGADAHADVKTETVVDASSGSAVDIETGDTDIDIEGDTQIWDFPSNSAFAPNGYTVIECSAVLGAAFTNRNGSGSLGLPIPRWLDRILFQRITDCEADADAVWLAEMGYRLASIESRCATSSMRRQFGQGVKGRQAQRDACVGHLKQTLIEERDLLAIERRIRELENQNETLATELANAKTATERCTDTFEQACGK